MKRSEYFKRLSELFPQYIAQNKESSIKRLDKITQNTLGSQH